eukprot:CAMPEP_0117495720 /NCGR_PEP_ID=MMETSP0784-20121206/20280_1 /TAXON_ID=39447 /ORGANISM="" /LENGTH=77 /DNA_ID=CAMNT_0005290655 /DNA_START=31 /DNA_END=260 /DNA_ORIENTATION=-
MFAFGILARRLPMQALAVVVAASAAVLAHGAPMKVHHVLRRSTANHRSARVHAAADAIARAPAAAALPEAAEVLEPT